MSDDLTQEAVDSAIILENKIAERVGTVARRIVRNEVTELVQDMLKREKGAMVMEITTTINQMLRGFVEQDRKPLWESTPEELGLDPTDLNRHMLGKDIDDAIRKQEAPVQERI